MTTAHEAPITADDLMAILDSPAPTKMVVSENVPLDECIGNGRGKCWAPAGAHKTGCWFA